MIDAAFDALPPLPQVATLRRITDALWAREEVLALWLGGSFARGAADEFSDLDLRVAVREDSLDFWSSCDLSALLGEVVVGQSGGTVFHQLVLGDGIILDLLVQSVEKDPPLDYTLILGCRDRTFGDLLAQAKLPGTESLEAADPKAICGAITDFWIGSHKHVKMLHRELDLLILFGLGIEQSVLIRLWYVAATGRDQGTQRATIHTLTPTMRAITATFGAHSLETLGTPRGNRADVIRAIECNRNEVAAVGRRLAELLGFEYPEALEQTVRETWRQYLTVERLEQYSIQKSSN
ncbi:MAG: nucleotidyltransferase family protein [Janthinobacterium lividum]